MIKNYARILPEEAVNEQSLRQVVARETGEAPKKYPSRTCIETFDRRTPANDICQRETACFHERDAQRAGISIDRV